MTRPIPTTALARVLRLLGSFGLNLGLAVGLLLSFALHAEAETKPDAARSLLLATTTSVQESGLLDALLPGFTKSSGYAVRVIAVGSGAAIEMARKGDADVVIAHSAEAEEALVRDGIATSRTSFMENFFVLVGPKSDPAGVVEAASPEAAFGLLFRSHAPFVSRADQSGTHVREQALVKAAGLDPKAPWPGRVETGSGMGPSLLVAGEKRAYILSDIATYLAFRDRVDLVVLSRPSSSLRNVYSVLQLDPKRFGHPIESEGAMALERHLLSPEVQRQIGAFGRDRFGEALFVPLAPGQAGR
ncbi:MAG: substrate-binding domain-containing protein [Deltaproteobacteria bacterium]|nr:substrate-binding domain-containing protein [Deltaproteobacteria bacterium]